MYCSSSYFKEARACRRVKNSLTDHAARRTSCVLKLFKTLTVCALLIMGFPLWSAAQVFSCQFIHAAESENPDLVAVDIYLGGVLFADNLAFGKTTPFLQIIPVANTVITIAPGNSTGSDAGFATLLYDFSQNGPDFQVIINGDLQNAEDPFSIIVNPHVRTASASPDSSDIVFFHLTKKVPSLDMVLRTGPMVLGGLANMENSGYISLSPDELYFDVKEAGTANVLTTIRMALQPLKGRGATVLVLGDDSLASTLKFILVWPFGFTNEIEYAPISRVQLINAWKSPIDLYKNFFLFANDLGTGEGTAYKYIPSELFLPIYIVPQDSTDWISYIADTSWTFTNMWTYNAFLVGPDTARPDFFMFWDAKEKATSDSVVELRLFNFDYLATGWNIVDEAGHSLFGFRSYGEASAYQSLHPGLHTFQIQNSEGTTEWQTQPLDLSTHGGKVFSLVLNASALADTTGAAPQLWLFDIEGNKTGIGIQTVSVNDAAPALFRVFPNPVQDKLHIQGIDKYDLNYRIFNATGILLQEGVLPGGTTSIDVHHLWHGLHLLQIWEEGTLRQTLTFIK